MLPDCCIDCGTPAAGTPGQLQDTRLGKAFVCEECATPRGHDPVSRILGIVFWVGTVAILVVGIAPALADFGRSAEPVSKLLAMLIGIPTGWAGLRWKRLRALRARRLLSDDERPVILYLRSFDDDARDARYRSIFAFCHGLTNENAWAPEEDLAEAVGHAGPFVAIGRPGEQLPKLGASRLYVTDDSWRRVAAGLMKRSACVILRAGETPGLAWELEHVASTLDPARVLLWTPIGKRHFRRFKAWADTVLPKALDVRHRRGGFIAFDEDWTPERLRRGRFTLGAAENVAETLRPYFRRLDIEMPRAVGIGQQLLTGAICFAVLVAIVLLLQQCRL
jgi:hypothetical protein